MLREKIKWNYIQCSIKPKNSRKKERERNKEQVQQRENSNSYDRF